MIAFALLLASPFAFADRNGASLELTENGKPVYVYNYGQILAPGAPEDRRRGCYLHPVYTPAGTVVTDDFPIDHYHHRGISWMWPVVRVDGQQHDHWMVKGIRTKFVSWIARETLKDRARFAVENGWFTAERQVLKETVEIVAGPVQGGARTLDLTLTFEAIGSPLEIAGTPDLKKGYGGLSFRFAPRSDTRVESDKGQEVRDTDLVPHPWAQLSGVFAGKPAAARVDIDPGNPGFPNGWCLRKYGLLGVNYPGLEPVTLTPGKPLRLKYRVTLRD